MPPALPKIAVTATALSDEIRVCPRLAQAAGFSGLLFDTAASGGQLLDLSSTGQREVRHLLASHNQALVGLSMKLPDKGFRPTADIEQAIDRVDRAMNALRGLGGEVVCVDLGPLPPAPATQPPKPKITPQMAGAIIIPNLDEPASEENAPPPVKPDPAFTASLTDALRELGVRADRYGVTLAFRSSLAGFAALSRALRLADCPWFGVDLDPVLVLADEWSIDDILSELGSLIRHVRVRDAIRGDNHRTQPAVVGEGDTDWLGLLSALDAAAYHGWLSVDPIDLQDRRAAATAALKHLRSLHQ